jgi:hypothetical protein
MSLIISDSSSLYYSPDVYVSIDNDRNRNTQYKIESVPVTSSYVLPNGVFNTSYFYPSINTYPMYQNISYLDINQDKDLHKKVTKNFYSKLYNKWIPEIYPNLLNYLKTSGNEVSLVKSINEAKNNTTKDVDFGKKINYLASEILTKVDLYELLLAYSDKKGVKWWDMSKFCEDIELYLIKKLEQKLRDLIL